MLATKVEVSTNLVRTSIINSEIDNSCFSTQKSYGKDEMRLYAGYIGNYDKDWKCKRDQDNQMFSN